MSKLLDVEKIVTIVTYEEFSDLVTRTGSSEITTMELIDAITQINMFIYELEYSNKGVL